MSLVYQRQGAPLEDYRLARADHRRQEEAVSIAVWVQEHVAKALPMSPETWERIQEMFGEPRTPEEKVTWRVRLYCGHIQETARPQSWSRPDEGAADEETCDACGLRPAIIVAYEPLEANRDQVGPA
ncbi:hypothetical protein [Streptomyces sp. BpilaLS-43]|uniref:hypothetical protein n=1 Tax=Streptomyces sp. BpilaLS-43 TaxID=1839778 RepID=UPI00114CF921|nr:hypothetical protein [Streptomyces sp. BpilaLS-43]